MLFVVGLPRSGTSLLFKTLNSHPAISLYYESDAYYAWPRLFSGMKQKGWGCKLDFWNGHLSRHQFTEDAIRDFPKANKREGMMFLYESLSQDGVKIVGEKSALYSSYLGKLRQDFPEAKFIILWRPLGEILDSVHRAAKGGDPYFSKKWLDYEYLGDLERLQRGVVELRNEGADCFEINFGDLITKKEESCREICKFIGVEYDDRMLSHEGFNNFLLPEGNHHSGVKENQLDADHDRGKGVSEEWSKRIARYEKRWEKKYTGTERDLGEVAEKAPSSFEGLVCDFFYLLSKYRMHVTVFLYWVLPISIAKKIRNK